MARSNVRRVAALAARPLASSGAAFAADGCNGLPTQAQLRHALIAARAQPNGGFALDMWGTIVNRAGVVCAVAFTGAANDSQWPGSRVISAQKANTANAFSLPGLALSTANLWAAVQPGGSLDGLQHGNPVDSEVACKGSPADDGTPADGMVGKRIGGIGVSGDTSCADHGIAWRTRANLLLDCVPGGAGVDATRPDNINDEGLVAEPSLANDFSHPICKIGGADGVSIISLNVLPVKRK